MTPYSGAAKSVNQPIFFSKNKLNDFQPALFVGVALVENDEVKDVKQLFQKPGVALHAQTELPKGLSAPVKRCFQMSMEGDRRIDARH